MAAKQFVVISYDVRCDKRRRKVAKMLEGHGTRVQYSVFEAWLQRKQIGELRLKLMRLITVEDSIRFYFIGLENISRIIILGNGKVTSDRIFYMV